ncbi:hypothetical protein J7L60_07190 [Candidatus Bathyarchaeota archaeon]|nr:hypothetical protein [Candidatus Bathyarchaeota archaeon]
MGKVRVETFKYLDETIKRMRSGGLLLVSVGRDGRPNVMTIGWGSPWGHVEGTLLRRRREALQVHP